MKCKYLSIGLIPLFFSSLTARTWTSADGGKTFEGELSSYNKDTKVVEVIKNGVKLKFTSDKLSSEDQDWLVQNASALEEAKAAKLALNEARSSSPILKHLRKVERLSEGRMKRAEIGSEVEFILLYYSASW